MTMLFTANKYTRWYYDIIDRAKTRVLAKEIYSEIHHIIPKSLGGNNGKSNYERWHGDNCKLAVGEQIA